MKQFCFIIIFCIVSANIVLSQSNDTLDFISLEPYDFHLAYLKDNNAILIDVREFFEYKKTRINSAINIPSSDDLQMSADTIVKEKALFIYCTTGFRSKRVSKYFSEHGFTKVYNLTGGISAWKKDDMPVERKRIKKS